MYNNQNERKSINLSKDPNAVREAYPRYNNNGSDNMDLQQQEYRNSPRQTTQYKEMQASGSQFNAPPVQPENASNPPAQYQNQFGHYYDYNDPQTNNGYQNQPQNNGYQNQPQNNGYQNQPQNNAYQNQPRNNAQFQNQMGYQQATKFCKYCGQKIAADAVICTHCGRQVEDFMTANNRSSGQGNNVTIMNTPYPVPNQGQPYGQSNISQKSKTAAIVLAALGFFGLAGIHRFYSGKIISGLFYLFTWGFFGLGTIIDIVKLANNTFTDSAGYLIKNP